MKFKLIVRWYRMLIGKSSFHVKQGAGKHYSKIKVLGYYNDLTNKVLSNQTLLDEKNIPYNILTSGEIVYFPGTIFQYALGLYDLFIETNDKEYLDQFINLANWAADNLTDNGYWKCMSVLHNSIHKTQSAMCQSEGISVLIRAYIQTKNKIYIEKSKKALELMIKPTDNGGTCYFNKQDIIFQEYVSDYNQSVLNGWIFSLFGLYDYYLITKDVKVEEILTQSINTLSKYLHKYDRGFWSNYDLVGTIASPAYHDLHIMQLRVLYDLFDINEFKLVADKWEKYQKSSFKKYYAMFIKFSQKMKKNKYYDINTNLVK